jgi:hypothetical protein
MGESKRRKKLDPTWGQSSLPSLGVEISSVTGKRLIVLYSKGHRVVVSPHISQDSLDYGLRQCHLCLQKMGAEYWANSFRKAIAEFFRLLNVEFDYPDDDEVIGVYQDGAIDFSLSKRNEVMAEMNIESIDTDGKRRFTHPPTMF